MTSFKYIHALFGGFRDAYTILKGDDKSNTSTTSLDANDVALVITEHDNLQLFLPESGVISDRGLAVVEIYNAMCRDKVGIVNILSL